MVVSEDQGRRVAGFQGLSTCGSVWACPVCASKVAARRQREVAEAVTTWHRRGGRVAMLTLTMRHHAGQSLADLWDGLAVAWARVTSGRAWVREQTEHGSRFARTVLTGAGAGREVVDLRVPFLRAVEVTHGEHGWHVHIHALLFVNGEASDESMALLRAQMFQRWQGALVKAGLPRPSWEHGSHSRLISVGDDAGDALGDYFTKAVYGASWETVGGQGKTARGNRTPFQVLADVHALGLADDLDLWREWELSSHGRRQLTWSPGLRGVLDLGREASDEEVVEEDTGGELVAVIPPGLWRWIVREHLTWYVLELVEDDPTAGLLDGFLTGVAAGLPEDWGD